MAEQPDGTMAEAAEWRSVGQDLRQGRYTVHVEVMISDGQEWLATKYTTYAVGDDAGAALEEAVAKVRRGAGLNADAPVVK